MKAIKKADIILIAALALSAIVMLIIRILTQKIPEPELEIQVGNEYYGTYSLDEDQVIKINDTNVCEIKDGKVTMIKASCPDHLCMEFRAIDKTGGSIICLPNQVILHIVNAEKAADAVDNTVR